MGYRLTYLIFKGFRAYLSTIIDLYDRHVVAYKIFKHNDNKLVMDTLNETKKEKDKQFQKKRKIFFLFLKSITCQIDLAL